MAMASSLEDIFAEIRSRVLRRPPALRAGAAGTYRFEVTGAGGGRMTLTVTEADAEVLPGEAGEAAVTFRLAMQDLRDLAGGRARPFGLVMTGRLKVSGNMGLALKLAEILKPD